MRSRHARVRSRRSLSDGPHLFAVRARVGASVSQAAGVELHRRRDRRDRDRVRSRRPDLRFDAAVRVLLARRRRDFKCRFDAAPFGPCSGPGNSHGPAAPLTDGPHAFKVKATDPLGNVDQTPAVRNFVVDTVDPEGTITTGPAAGSKTKDTTPTFGFSSNETGSTFECKLDTAAFGPCSGPGLKHTTATLGDGQHTFRVRATDAAGNADRCRLRGISSSTPCAPTRRSPPARRPDRRPSTPPRRSASRRTSRARRSSVGSTAAHSGRAVVRVRSTRRRRSPTASTRSGCGRSTAPGTSTTRPWSGRSGSTLRERLSRGGPRLPYCLWPVAANAQSLSPLRVSAATCPTSALVPFGGPAC